MVSTTKLALALPSLGSQGVAGGLLLLGLILTITTGRVIHLKFLVHLKSIFDNMQFLSLPGALLRKRRRKREEFLSLEGIKS